MKVLHVSDVYLPNLGGIEALVSDLSRNQVEAGLSPVVLTRQPGQSADGPVPVIRDPRALSRLLPQVDVAHVHLSVHSPLGWRAVSAAGRAGIPTVATVHSMWTGVWPIIRTLDQVAGVGSLPVVWSAVSGEAALRVQAALTPCEGVVVLPNAIDVASWRSDLVAPPAERPITLVSTMRMAHRKRPIELLRMLAAVRRQVPNAIPLRAVLIGDGPLLARARRTADRLGLAEWVSLPGRSDQADLRRLYQQADIFVSPTRLESFGIAALEARAAGLAVAGLAGTGLSEFVRDGVEGALLPSDAALVAQVAAWCADPVSLRPILDHNREVAPAFDWSHAAARYLAAYEQAGSLRGRSERARGALAHA